MTKEKKLISKIAQLREAAGLTQRQLADLTDTTVITISNWERNRTGVEQLARVAKLCRALNCSPDDLTEEVDTDG